MIEPCSNVGEWSLRSSMCTSTIFSTSFSEVSINSWKTNVHDSHEHCCRAQSSSRSMIDRLVSWPVRLSMAKRCRSIGRNSSREYEADERSCRSWERSATSVWRGDFSSREYFKRPSPKTGERRTEAAMRTTAREIHMIESEIDECTIELLFPRCNRNSRCDHISLLITICLLDPRTITASIYSMIVLSLLLYPAEQSHQHCLRMLVSLNKQEKESDDDDWKRKVTWRPLGRTERERERERERMKTKIELVNRFDNRSSDERKKRWQSTVLN